MEKHVDEVNAQRGEESTTTQSVASNTPQGEKHIHDICINERLLLIIITKHVLLTLYVVVVDSPVLQQHPLVCRTTRNNIMVGMKHSNVAWIEDVPTNE
jgi:hypothetical protein